MTIIRCQKKYCRHILVLSHMDPIGRPVFVCEPCDRNAKGFCRDCPAKLTAGKNAAGHGSNAMRCDSCVRRHLADNARARYRANPEHFRAIRRRSNRRPAVAAKQREARAEWLANRPKPARTALDNLYARAMRARYMADPVKAERIRQHNRRYAQLRREQRQRERAA